MWFAGIVESTTHAEQIVFLIGLDEVFAEDASRGAYACDRTGSLSSVTIPPCWTHAYPGRQGRRRWLSGDHTFLHRTVEILGLLLAGVVISALEDFGRKRISETTPFPFLVAYRKRSI